MAYDRAMILSADPAQEPSPADVERMRQLLDTPLVGPRPLISNRELVVLGLEVALVFGIVYGLGQLGQYRRR